MTIPTFPTTRALDAKPAKAVPLRGVDGRFLPRVCPECSAGTLQPDLQRCIYHCDGLVDPGDLRQELQPCPFTIEMSLCSKS